MPIIGLQLAGVCEGPASLCVAAGYDCNNCHSIHMELAIKKIIEKKK